MVKFSINKLNDINKLIRDGKLSRKSFFIFFVMCEKALIGNRVPLNMIELANITNTHRNHIYKCVKSLKDLNMIKYEDGNLYLNKDIVTIIPEKDSVLKDVEDTEIFLYSGFSGIFEPESLYCASHKYIHKFHAMTKDMSTRTLNDKGQKFIDEIDKITEHDTFERHLLMMTAWTWYTKEGYDEH